MTATCDVCGAEFDSEFAVTIHRAKTHEKGSKHERGTGSVTVNVLEEWRSENEAEVAAE